MLRLPRRNPCCRPGARWVWTAGPEAVRHPLPHPDPNQKGLKKKKKKKEEEKEKRKARKTR